MRRVVRYEIIHASTLPALAASVEEFCRAGWLPQGGIAVGPASFPDVRYIQAMVYGEEF